jgi:hypothetical protein
MSALKSILIIVPYFGQFPEWFPLYLESCRWNPTVNWLFFTDCTIPDAVPPNTQFVPIAYGDYCQLISDRLQIPFPVGSPYKLCDVKPAYGAIHQDYLDGYDYFGFGDIDVIYGDIRAFYTDSVLGHNTISTLDRIVSGHLFLMKNQPRWINAFRQIPDWQTKLSHPDHQCLDEYWLTKVLRGNRQFPKWLSRAMGWVDPYKRHHLFVERHASPLVEWAWKDGTFNYPLKWYWLNGKLTNEQGEEFLYLHFMNFKSSKYLPDRYKQHYGQQAFWEPLSRLVDPTVDLTQGWCICPQGFTPLPKEAIAPLVDLGLASDVVEQAVCTTAAP